MAKTGTRMALRWPAQEKCEKLTATHNEFCVGLGTGIQYTVRAFGGWAMQRFRNGAASVTAPITASLFPPALTMRCRWSVSECGCTCVCDGRLTERLRQGRHAALPGAVTPKRCADGRCHTRLAGNSDTARARQARVSEPPNAAVWPPQPRSCCRQCPRSESCLLCTMHILSQQLSLMAGRSTHQSAHSDDTVLMTTRTARKYSPPAVCTRSL